jgi:hypothetical protein
MDSIINLPEWFGTAIFGAIFAALGYCVKIFVDWWQTKRKENANILSPLL